MKITNERFFKYRHFLALLSWLILLPWFGYLEKTTVPKFYMYSVIDNYIPFIKGFIIPYELWYFYVFAGLLFLGFTSKKDFLKLQIYLFLCMSISYVIYMLFPNAQNLRPAIRGNDILTNLIKLLYKIDTPTNVSPSIHVSDAIAVHLAFLKCSVTRNKKVLIWTSLILMISICASTILIKQHSIIDVFGGILLAGVLYFPIYELPKVIYNRSSKKEKQVITQE